MKLKNPVWKNWNWCFGTLQIYIGTKKIMDFSNLIFQLHPIITSLILDQLACSLPKSNTTFHQIFKYVKKGANFPFFEWENSKYIFGRRSSIETVYCWTIINLQMYWLIFIFPSNRQCFVLIDDVSAIFICLPT